MALTLKVYWGEIPFGHKLDVYCAKFTQIHCNLSLTFQIEMSKFDSVFSFENEPTSGKKLKAGKKGENKVGKWV